MSQLIELTRIEVVMHLQHVELFNFCSTEEVLRIASIVEPETMEEGSVIYRVNQRSEKLYCVISGQVLLASDDGSEATVERNGAFGVLDILSGRLRTHEARALEATTTLAIEAEDFFDLLSNNIEIVKGLFREILRAGGVAEGRPEPAAEEGATNPTEVGGISEADSNVVPLQRRAVSEDFSDGPPISSIQMAVHVPGNSPRVAARRRYRSRCSRRQTGRCR